TADNSIRSRYAPHPFGIHKKNLFISRQKTETRVVLLCMARVAPVRRGPLSPVATPFFCCPGGSALLREQTARTALHMRERPGSLTSVTPRGAQKRAGAKAQAP